MTMIQSQNPNTPTPISAVGIDAAIQEILLKLNVNLSWLSHGYSRAYRFLRNQDGKSFYFPEIYLGVQNGIPQYHRVTPENDKKGSCFFVVQSELIEGSKPNVYSYSKYNVSIIFSVNLELINGTLLETDSFTENLIEQVKAVLHRKMQGVSFELNIISVEREQPQIWKDYSINPQEQYLRNPLSAFRFNLTIKTREGCESDISKYDRCLALANTITYDDLFDCILPTFGIALNTDVTHLQELTPLAVSGNNQLASNSAILANAAIGTALFFHFNHRLFRVSRGVKNELAYFSNDGGLTAKTEIEIGDKLYINALNLGFNLNTTDTLEISFTKIQGI